MIITVVSASEFSAYQPTPSTAVIRIYDPTDAWVEDAAVQAASGWGKVLPMAFWDVGRVGMGIMEHLTVRLLGRWRNVCLAVGNALFGDKDIPWRPFLTADAREICAFGDSLDETNIRNIIVVCHNGRARGGTVATWLARHLGIELTNRGGWQRESESIAATFAKICPKRDKKTRQQPNLAAFGM